ncbi:unnamed protein product [Dracunculus medinensis]|uniref:Condensin complex subunit 2 n=1 Tax=Dracunculus medinensis TaxID=318479 RepID=A0A0N4UKP4_DRAME|nr:unnamed protein product [Dracunculus medinensis]
MSESISNLNINSSIDETSEIEKEIKDNSNLSTPHQTFDYTQNTLSILNKTLNQRKYYANVMKKDVTNSVFDVFDDINRKESFCSLGIFIKYKLNWSKSLSSSPTVDYVTNSSEKFNIERDFKGQFEEMNSEVSQSSILVDSDNDNDNGDDDLDVAISGKRAVVDPLPSMSSGDTRNAMAESNKSATYRTFEKIGYLSADVRKESAEEQFNRVGPDAPADTVTFTADPDELYVPQCERNGSVVDLFCDMLADERFTQTLFSHFLTNEEMQIAKND